MFAFAYIMFGVYSLDVYCAEVDQSKSRYTKPSVPDLQTPGNGMISRFELTSVTALGRHLVWFFFLTALTNSRIRQGKSRRKLSYLKDPSLVAGARRCVVMSAEYEWML